jgi:hypothetical protein
VETKKKRTKTSIKTTKKRINFPSTEQQLQGAGTESSHPGIQQLPDETHERSRRNFFLY